jgi:hypothetical protein
MKIIIAGGRDFDDYDLLVRECKILLDDMNVERIVSGHAKGADSLGEKFAFKHDYDIKIFEAKWDIHGKAAGYLRNNDMAIYADMLIAFWDGKSRGTQDMIKLAKNHGLMVHVITYGPQPTTLF